MYGQNLRPSCFVLQFGGKLKFKRNPSDATLGKFNNQIGAAANNVGRRSTRRRSNNHLLKIAMTSSWLRKTGDRYANCPTSRRDFECSICKVALVDPSHGCAHRNGFTRRLLQLDPARAPDPSRCPASIPIKLATQHDRAHDDRFMIKSALSSLSDGSYYLSRPNLFWMRPRKHRIS
jgi:hypothetical protein